MNQKLIDYLDNCGMDAKFLLAESYSKCNRKEVVNIIYSELQKTPEAIKPARAKRVIEEAQEAGVLKVLCQTKTFISVQFEKPAPVKKATKTKPKKEATKIITLKQPDQPISATSEKQNLVAILPIKSDRVAISDGLVLMEPPLPDNYKPSAGLIRAVIGDYCEFYKNMIRQRALLAGVELKSPMNPKISGYEVIKMRELCEYFAENGFGDWGEEGIRKAFLRIYAHWHLLPLNYQNYFQPQQINRNINGIYAEMVNFKQKRNNNRKDEELAEKHQQSQPEDFSHLVTQRS